MEGSVWKLGTEKLLGENCFVASQILRTERMLLLAMTMTEEKY
jgi:hypothetical protein